MEDLEGSEKLIFKLFVLLCFDVFTIQPDFLARGIAMALYSFVIGFFAALVHGIDSGGKLLSAFSAF